jgi:predicted phage tail protein
MVNPAIYRGLYVLGEGPFEGPVTEELARSVYFNDVPAQDSGGHNNFSGFSLAYRSGLPDQTYIAGFEGAVAPVSVGVEVTHDDPVEVTIAGDFDAVNVVIRFPNGLYGVAGDGSQKGEDADYNIEVKASGSSIWVAAHHELMHYQKIVSQFENTHRVDLPAGGSPWLVRVVRNSVTDTNPNTINEFNFQRYETIVDGKFTYPNIGLLAVEIGAKQFENQIPRVSIKAKGLKIWVPKNYDPVARTYATTGVGTSGGTWDGTFKTAYCNNPVWVYYDIVVNNRYGLGLELICYISILR